MVREVCIILHIVFLSLILFPSLGAALNPDRLWLPKKYHKYYVSLLKASEAAEATHRCSSIQEGTIDLGQSDKDHPIFRILCLQSNGRTYNEMVDGLTFETLTTPKPTGDTKLRKQAQIKSLKASYWLSCQSAVKEKAYLMKDVTWLTTIEPAPLSFKLAEEEDGDVKDPADALQAEATFCIDFNAKSPGGSELKYQAICDIGTSKPPEIIIKKR